MASPYSLTDNDVIQAPYALSYGNILTATYDLRTAAEAWVFMGVGLSGTTSLTNGVNMTIKRRWNNGSGVSYHAEVTTLGSRTTVGRRLVNGAHSAGVSSIAYDDTGGTAMVVGDMLCFWGVTAIPGSDGLINPSNGAEFLRMAKLATPLITNGPCGVAKLDNEIFAQGDCMSVYLAGGSLYEFVWDYADDTAGDRVLCMAHAQKITYV